VVEATEAQLVDGVAVLDRWVAAGRSNATA
jgi:hypothetical protein